VPRVRHGFARLLLSALLVFALGAGHACAEELSVLGGLTDTDDHTSASYAWGLEYRERLLSYLDASLGYLNEGHLLGHHRDGGTAQLWGRLPLSGGRFTLAIGAGPYAYFDTLTDPSAREGYRDSHGVGVIASAAVRYSLSEHWFALLKVNQVATPDNPGTRTVLFGVGARLDRVMEALSRRSNDGSASSGSDPPNEVGVFFGETILNGLHADDSNAFGAEYRRRVTRWFELSAAVLSDSDGLDGRHQAATAEGWLVQQFPTPRLSVGLGLGPYISLQSYRTIYGDAGAHDLRFTWHRGFTSDDQDRDIVVAGVGWRF
jgi:hypothetical protein